MCYVRCNNCYKVYCEEGYDMELFSEGKEPIKNGSKDVRPVRQMNI